MTIGIDGANRTRPEEYTALRGLWASVLMNACEDYAGVSVLANGSDRRKEQNTGLLQRQAESYVKSDAMHVGSFVWICGVLGLNPDAVRERLEDDQYRKHMGGRWRERYRGMRA